MFFKTECCTVLFQSWHTIAQGFGKSRLCSTDPGQSNIACLIKSKSLNMSIYSACHGAPAGQCEHSYINSWRIFSNSGRVQAASHQGHRMAILSLPPETHTKAWYGSSGRGLLHCGWVIPEGCRTLSPWQKCRVNLLVQKCLERARAAFWMIQRCWHTMVAGSDWSPWDCPVFLQGGMFLKGVTGRLMSQLLKPQSPQCSVSWDVPLTRVMLWSSTVNCSCTGADSHPFHLFLMKLSGTIFVSFLHLLLSVGQPEMRN